MLFVHVALPLHLGYGVSSAAWLLVLRSTQLEHSHTPPRAGFTLFVAHICAVFEFHVGALTSFEHGLGATTVQAGSASAVPTVASAARGVYLLTAVTCLQFVQSIALYTAASLFVLQMRAHSAGPPSVWVGHLASVGCVACASLFVVIALVSMEAGATCIACDFSASHVVICCNLFLVVAAALHASMSRMQAPTTGAGGRG